MEPVSGHTRSLWADTAEVPRFTRLEADARADVCVVGAGIAGLTTAYLLAREGRSVIVVDDGPIGGGESGRTTAHLASAMDDRFIEVERVHGEEGARLAAESHGAAIDRFEAIVRDEGIRCDFRRLDGYLFLGEGTEPELLDRELAAAHRAGLRSAERLPRAPLNGFETGPCLRFPRQAQLQPLDLLGALALCITRDGGRIYEDSRVMNVEDGSPAYARTRHGPTVRAEYIVIATNSPAAHYLTTLKMVPYRTFVIGLAMPSGSMQPALYWDTEDPYHYVRVHPRPRGDVLIVGGGDYQSGTKDEGEDRFEQLERWTRARFPEAEKVRYQWSGQVLEPADFLAFIGRDPGAKQVFLATGDSGQGMTHGMIAGMLISDLIAGRSNPWEKLYAPNRLELRAAKAYLIDGLKVGIRYLDYIRPADAASTDEIAPGEGAVLRKGLKRVAIYRDEAGALHERSAVCTHAGCVVHWNSTEKSWDCPCHGSRYDPYGEVLNGPAVNSLQDSESESSG